MAKSKNNTKKLSCISVPSQIINTISSSSLQSLLDETSEKSSRNNGSSCKSLKFWFFTLLFVGFLGMLKFGFNHDIPFSPYPCITTPPQLPISNGYSKSELGFVSENGKSAENGEKDETLTANVQLEAEGPSGPVEEEENDEIVENSEFGKQPDGLGYRPCLDFSRDYRRATQGIVKDRRKYLMVVLSGGMNQQRNQIVDAFVIARILGAALVVPMGR